MSLPQRINVMKVVSYDVQQLVDDIYNWREIDPNEITIEDCLEFIQDWVCEEFGTLDGLIYQDENGEEL